MKKNMDRHYKLASATNQATNPSKSITLISLARVFTEPPINKWISTATPSTIAFYSLLGFDFSESTGEEEKVEPAAPRALPA